MVLDNIENSLSMEIELDEDMVQTDGSPTNDFNNIIGFIEDIVISDSFQVKTY